MARDQQICIYLSEQEKKQLDSACDYYCNMSRADFVRVAMFLATYNQSIFMAAVLKAQDEGYLTGKPHKRYLYEKDQTKRCTM